MNSSPVPTPRCAHTECDRVSLFAGNSHFRAPFVPTFAHPSLPLLPLKLLGLMTRSWTHWSLNRTTTASRPGGKRLKLPYTRSLVVLCERPRRGNPGACLLPRRKSGDRNVTLVLAAGSSKAGVYRWALTRSHDRNWGARSLLPSSPFDHKRGLDARKQTSSWPQPLSA